MFSVTETNQMNQFMPPQDYVYVDEKERQDTEQEQEQEADLQEDVFTDIQPSRLPRLAKDNLERAREMTESGYDKYELY
jgi:hypothetical protein